MWRPDASCVIPEELSALTGSLTQTWSLPIAHWLASEFQKCACLCPLALGLQACTIVSIFFIWVMGIQSQVHMHMFTLYPPHSFDL